MKKIALAFTAALVLSLTPANAASMKKGNAAYHNKDYATARMEWQPLANEGNAAAQNNMGVLYGYGKGVAQDYAQAAKWYRLAALNGHTSAPNA
jgi:TPR repeat protein